MQSRAFTYLIISLCVITCFFAGLAQADCPPADLSGDCEVGIADLAIFADAWLSTEGGFHPGLVARWRLDESDSETAQDDVSGYTGQLHGDPQWMPAEGYQAGALFFDGIDDYVEIAGFKGITGLASRTCSAWINTSEPSFQIVTWGGLADGAKWAIRVNEDGTLRAEVQGGYIYGVTDIADNAWHHIAVTFSGNETLGIDDVRLYVDGQLQQIGGKIPQIINTAAEADVKIGINITGANSMPGKIDDLRIYDCALSAPEIASLFATGSAKRHNPDFNADQLTNLYDFGQIAHLWGMQEPAVIINEFLASNDSDNPPVVEEGQLLDGNGESSDWIELFNQTDFPVDLSGWGLSDDAGDAYQWQFPSGTILPARSYMVLFASGRSNDEYPYTDSAGYLHTNFNLSTLGEHLSLTRSDGTIAFAYNSVANGFPEQQENISYGLLQNEEYYFALPTPGAENRSHFLGFVEAPDFSHERGYYESSFYLSLSCPTEGATIRYTTNGSEPTLSNGITYDTPVGVLVSTLPASRCIRAAAFKPGFRASEIKSKTYLLKADSAMKGLPAICLSGSSTQTFFNPNGIMAIVGGAWGGSGWYKINPTDYNNVLGHGMAYERPVSMEYMNPFNGEEFQEDCGIRVHGSAWMRPRYTPPSSGMWSGTNKYSFRLYFRGEYGKKELDTPILPRFPHVDTMDTVVLRAGHNDQVNPFVRDEMIRRLQYYSGHHASLGSYVNLFINGSYKGYYNVCERLDEEFFQKYYGSELEWDVVGWVQPDNVLEARDGDMAAFNAFINYVLANNLADPVHYSQVVRQLDLTQFIDYIIVQCWGGNWDWPQNNWTAASERSPDRKWRFYVWDAEGAMDGDLGSDRFYKLLSSDGDRSDLSRLFKALYANEDFRILFGDRVQRHFFEKDSVMRPEFLSSVFSDLADEVKGVIPSINSYIQTTYIPGRQSVFLNQCTSRSLFTFQGPEILFNGSVLGQQGEGVTGNLLSFQNAAGQSGSIYFTLDGSDPRVPVSERLTTTILVTEDAPKRVLIPSGNISSSWRSQVNYNDSGWTAGLPADSTKTGGVGYENDAVGNKAYISYDVRNVMYNQRTSAYIRIPFTVDAEALADWNYLTLSMRYDDGFVAYINGTEVCRRSFSGDPLWNSRASSSHENSYLEEFNINAHLAVLQPGQNILAIHGLNIGSDSSDFVISPILTAGRAVDGSGISPVAQRYTSPVALDKSARVKARTLNGSTWSAMREAGVNIGFAGETLRISEIMYNPFADPNEEFIELVNNGTDPINLYGIQFSEGLDYTFGDVSLPAGAYLLLVRDQAVFESRYGTGLPVQGTYGGALNNAGETLRLVDLAGNTIQEVDYKDTWYSLADGEGFSLTAIDSAYDRTAELVSGAAARWAFDEPSGTAVVDSAGAHSGTIYNMQNTTRIPGHQYKALMFDGIDDYIEMAGYKGISGKASRSCSGWINTTQNSFQIINWGGQEPGTKWAVRLNEDGTLRAEVQSGYVHGVTNLADGNWHHFAVVLPTHEQPSCSDIILFVDGQMESVGGLSSYPIDTGTEMDVKIGTNIAGVGFVSGILDDVRIYDRALTADEICLLAAGISWSDKDMWRPSAVYGGTPGRGETAQEQLPLPGSIVINEVLAHSHAGLPDWVELYNTTDQSIAIGGWFLSDSSGTDAEIKKFQIPAGVILTPSNPYYVLDETRFNNASDPACRIPFGLSEGGETVYLQSASGETLTGFLVQEEFDASESNVSFGRFQKSTGGWNFVPMSAQTKGAANAYPKVGPLIMTEIMYNPGPETSDKDCEYIELMNISAQPVRTASYVSTYTDPTSHFEEWISWRFDDGIDFEFPADLEVNAGEKILLVKNLTAFNSKYTAPGGVRIFQWTSGSLDNAGEKLQLSMPGDQEYGKQRYYIRHDRVNYDDEGDWPAVADGSGKGLTHLAPTQAGGNYTNDAGNWTAADPTPGW